RPPPYRKRRDIVIYTVAAFYGHHLQPNARKLRGERDVHDALCPYSVQLLGHEYVYHPARTDYRHADRVWTCVYFQLCDPTQLGERAGVRHHAQTAHCQLPLHRASIEDYCRPTT